MAYKCDKFKQIRGAYLSPFDLELRDSDYSISSAQTKAKITRAKADRASMARALNNHMARCKVCS